MKLYYKPGACSLASHIALREAGADFSLERVDTDTNTTQSGGDYSAINPNGYVPALRLDEGEVLTEGAAVLQFIAERYPDARLAPVGGGLARSRLHEQLNFVASELHKAFGPFFSESATGEQKDAAAGAVGRRLDHVERWLADGRTYLNGDGFTVADAYLFVVAGWAVPTGLGLDRWPHVEAFVARVADRDAAKAAMRAEGLIH